MNNSQTQHFKALIFDLDGTAVPNREDGVPSPRLIKAVAKAKQRVFVSIATGRPIYNSRRILQLLNIESPCIISGGTQIIDPVTEKTLWEKKLSINQVTEIMKVCVQYPYQFYCSDEEEMQFAKDKKVDAPERIIWIMSVNKKDVEKMCEELNQIENVAIHAVNSWEKDCFDIHITHIEATKKYALEQLLKMENLRKEEVMAVGDSNNDLPLFEMAGFKVAMGNASEELKAQADFITDDVKDDGLAKVIEEKIIDV